MTAILTEGDALLADIIANPADDGLRLIYADWLSENGQETHAEFIRVQVELSQPHNGGKHSVGDLAIRTDLFERERQLLDLGSEPDGFNSHVPSYVREWWYRRGFVWKVKLPLQDWMKHREALKVAHPIERVEVSDKRPRRGPATRHGYDGPVTVEGEWGWWPRGDWEYSLTEKIAVLMRQPDAPPTDWLLYPSEQDANDALSAALLAMTEKP